MIANRREDEPAVVGQAIWRQRLYFTGVKQIIRSTERATGHKGQEKYEEPDDAIEFVSKVVEMNFRGC